MGDQQVLGITDSAPSSLRPPAAAKAKIEQMMKHCSEWLIEWEAANARELEKLRDMLKSEEKRRREIEDWMRRDVQELQRRNASLQVAVESYAEDRRKAEEAAQRLNNQIKMLEEINAQQQEYNNNLNLYRSTFGADAASNGEAITKLQNEKNVVVESLIQTRREKDELLKRNIELQRQQGAKQKLELEIEQLKQQLLFMSKMDEVLEAKKQIEELNKELNDKNEDLDFLSSDYDTVIVKELLTNNLFQEVRRALIKGVEETESRQSVIGIKKMGQLDFKPFRNAFKKRSLNYDAETNAVMLYTKWQEEIKKPDWLPYKTVRVDGKTKEVIDKEDEILKALKNELGRGACSAVTHALLELNEYNPSGRFAVSELWHLKEDRKASAAEAVEYLFGQLKDPQAAERIRHD